MDNLSETTLNCKGSSFFKVSIIIPIFNEEGNVAIIAKTLVNILSNYPDYEIIFINDGSKDQTLSKVKMVNKENSKIGFLSFSRNFGHQAALRAGLDYATGDCVISMDGDMQHPPELIPQLIDKWKEGYDIVYTRRKDDASISFFKKKTSQGFYKLINLLSDIEIDPGAADFRLVDKKVIAALRQIKEGNLFMRGMISWIGFEQFSIDYVPHERHWGKSKYTFKKMFNLALSGITSFSIRPLHISTILGAIIAAVSFIYGLYSIYEKLFTPSWVLGWASLITAILFMGGIQLLMIGVLGEYLGKIFIESKMRPHYIIKEQSASVCKITSESHETI